MLYNKCQTLFSHDKKTQTENVKFIITKKLCFRHLAFNLHDITSNLCYIKQLMNVVKPGYPMMWPALNSQVMDIVTVTVIYSRSVSGASASSLVTT